MPRLTETRAVRPVKTIGELRSHFLTIWEEPLRSEGFGRWNTLDPTEKPDVMADIDSLIEYQKLASAYGRSAFDMDNRERMLVEFVSPVFTLQSLQDTIIPRKSFVRKIVDQLSMLYKEEPTRWLANDEDVLNEDATYQSLIDRARICSKGKEWYKRFVLTRCVCIRPIIRQRAGVGYLTYDVMTPNDFRCQYDDNNELVKLLYQVQVDGEFRVAVWTRDEHYYRTPKGDKMPVGDNLDMVNPYRIGSRGIIPAVVITDNEADIYGGGLNDLVEANNYANFLELLQTSDIAFATLQMWIAKNMHLSEREVLSPGRVFDFDDVVEEPGRPIPPAIDSISGTPQSQLIRDIMDANFKQAAIAEGMSVAMLETTVRELSGRALKEMKAELLDRRADDADVMGDFEPLIYECTAIVANYAKRTGALKMDTELPVDTAIFQIDFADEDFDSLDADKKYELEKQQVKDGILSPLDWFRRYNPDIDEATDVMAAMQKNLADLKQITGTGGKSWLTELMGSNTSVTPTPAEQTNVDQTTVVDKLAGQ